MAFNPFSRTKLHMSLALAVLAIVGSAALSTPASAAKQSDVVAACKRTKGCVLFQGTNGGVAGCSPHACFSCTKGKCVQTSARVGNSKSGVKRKIGNATLRNRTTTTGTRINRGGTAPVRSRASNSNHVRMGHRH